MINKCTNCLNCGAPLKYDEGSYESTAKCKYCNTEYHIDRLGMVEEYKVKIKMYGKIISFYIGSVQVEPIYIEPTYIMDVNGYSRYIEPLQSYPDITLELHSYNVEKCE